MDRFEKTERGFVIYGRLTDSKGSVVRVQESSIIGEPCAWIFADNPEPSYKHPSPHLTAENAKELIAILSDFILDSEARTVE